MPPAPESRPVRVMHLVHRLGLGGTEYNVLKVANHLEPDRFTPSIVSFRSSASEARAMLHPNVRFLDLERREGLDLGLIGRLARRMREERTDLVHSHNWSTYFYAVPAARLAGVPIVVHGEHGRETARPNGVPTRRIMERFLARFTTHFTVVSRDLLEHIHRSWRVPLEKISLIPNGVDLDRFGAPQMREPARTRFGFTPEDPTILSVGAFRVVKDHETLVRAFQRVLQSVPRARLVLAGIDPNRRFERRMEDTMEGWGRLRERIDFLGVRTDIPDLLAACDVYVNTSIYEGMSNTVLEAMASRRPVVATAVGGTPDLLTHEVHGLLVPPRSPDALASAVLRLLGDSRLREELGRAGRRRVEEQHTFSRMVRANEDLYTSLRARRSTRLVPSAQLKRLGAAAAGRLGILTLADRRTHGALTVLGYHRVLPLVEKLQRPGQTMIVSAESFKAQMVEIARSYRPLGLEEVRGHFARREAFPRRSVWVTFDDGYADSVAFALPILRELGIPATFFLTTGPIDTGSWLWWDEVAALMDRVPATTPARAARPTDLPTVLFPHFDTLDGTPGGYRRASDGLVRALNRRTEEERHGILAALQRWVGGEERPRARIMLRWDDVRRLVEAGMSIGGHTVNHRFLDVAGEPEAIAEIEGSLRRIQEETGVRPVAFSYPRGRKDDAVRGWLARCGLELAVTTEPGVNRVDCDPLSLKRRDAAFLSIGETHSRWVLRAELSGIRDARGAARVGVEHPGQGGGRGGVTGEANPCAV